MSEKDLRGRFLLGNSKGKRSKSLQNRTKIDEDFRMMWQYGAFQAKIEVIYLFSCLTGMPILMNCLIAVKTGINWRR